MMSNLPKYCETKEPVKNGNDGHDRQVSGREDDDDDNNNKSFAGAVVALCVCSLTNAVVMINVFPYSGYMVMHLLPGNDITLETAAPYAGCLAASFMVGRFVTAYAWGQVADVFGRVPVLQASMLLSLVCSILFGTSSSYTMAVWWRFCLGMSNAVTSTCKTLASEIGGGQHDNDNNNAHKKEQCAMGLVVGMRSWGFLLGPAMGGLLADPIQQYPFLFSSSSTTTTMLLTKFPFLLPNLVVAMFCLVGAVTATLYIEETLCDQKHLDLTFCFKGFCARFCGQKQQKNVNTISSSDILENELTLLKGDDENNDNGAKNDKHKKKETPEMSIIWNRPNTRQLMIFYWIFSFGVTLIDEAFPLFCMSTIGGLSLDEASIGVILSIAGIMFALCQYVVYTFSMNRLGVMGSIQLGCAFALLPACGIPLSTTTRSWWSSNSSNSSQSTWWVFGYLSIILGFCKIMACTCFSSLAIATNKTVPSQQRAKMNALLLLGASVTKAASPIFAGWLVSVSFSTTTGGHHWIMMLPAEYGSYLIFGTVGVLGIITTLFSLRLESPDRY